MLSFSIVVVIVLLLQMTTQGDHRASLMQEPGEWGAPTLLENDDGTIGIGYEVDHDSQGNAIAVWEQKSGTQYPIFSSRYVRGTGWGAPEPISNGSLGNAYYPRVSVSPSGDAVCVWLQFPYGSGHFSIYANRYSAGSGWGNPVPLELDETGNAESPDVFVAPDGNAIAVWTQVVAGSNYCVWANRYEVSSGEWGIPEHLDAEVGRADHARIAGNPSGDGIAAWGQTNGTYTHIWAARYDSLDGWETAELIEANVTSPAYSPKPAIDSYGNAIVVWSIDEGGFYHAWANRYEIGKGWGNATWLDKQYSGAGYPEVAVDSDGNGIAVFGMGGGMKACHYSVGAGWEDPVAIENGYNATGDPTIDFDSYGNAICAWAQKPDTTSVFSICVNRFDASLGWSPESARSIESHSVGDAQRPQISCDVSGNAIVIWYQSVDTAGTRWNMWANTYEVTVIPEFSDIVVPITGTGCVVVLASVLMRRRS